uniref:Endonuclease/exonuclease/phosphatase domain-containing protein n=1 Tax=Eptatretus burgeri TaxID=7764 RepID=A0A8C4Q2U7_EPTBU
MIIASLNINGGRNPLCKVQTMQLINYVKVDILLSQETRVTASCMADWRLKLKGTWFFSNTASLSAGIAFYVSPHVPISSLVFKEIVPGYLAVIDFIYNCQRILIVNVYAFFTDSFTFLKSSHPNTLLCLGDDFNCTLDPVRDRNIHSTEPLSTHLLQHDLDHHFPRRSVFGSPCVRK